jgi:hypothetical protein
MMIWMIFSLIFLSSANDLGVFDESAIACSQKDVEKKCALVLCGSKLESWVGHLVVAQRGQKGDVNDFLKEPANFSSRIKKKTLKEIFNNSEKMSTLAGHLEFDKKKQEWSAYVEGQFEKNLDKMEKRLYPLKGIYDK